MVKGLKSSLTFVAFLWIILVISFLINIKPFLGIRPLEISGLIGIITSPFIHGGISHLASNSIPLIVLMTMLLTFYQRISFRVMAGIVVLGGLAVWLFGGHGTNHIGASGLIYGLAAFIFLSGILRRNLVAIILSIVIFFLYGGLVYGVLPGVPGVSWQGHLFGALAGGLLAFIYRKEKEAYQVKRRYM